MHFAVKRISTLVSTVLIPSIPLFEGLFDGIHCGSHVCICICFYWIRQPDPHQAYSGVMEPDWSRCFQTHMQYFSIPQKKEVRLWGYRLFMDYFMKPSSPYQFQGIPRVISDDLGIGVVTDHTGNCPVPIICQMGRPTTILTGVSPAVSPAFQGFQQCVERGGWQKRRKEVSQGECGVIWVSLFASLGRIVSSHVFAGPVQTLWC